MLEGYVTNGGDCERFKCRCNFLEVGYMQTVTAMERRSRKKILSCGTDVEGYVTNGGDCDDSNRCDFPKLGVCRQ